MREREKGNKEERKKERPKDQPVFLAYSWRISKQDNQNK